MPGARQERSWRVAADGTSFRDLNGNGELDPYEDPRLPVEERVDDLLARMTLEEKAAQLFHQGLLVPDDGAVGEEPDGFSPVATRALVAELGPDALQHLLDSRPVTLAEWHNRMQEAAEATRLGIPVTISSDPRHGLGDNPATSMAGAGFSQVARPDRAGCDPGRGSRARVRRRRATGVPRRRHPRWPSTRRQISRPSHAGAARPERSARMRSVVASLVAAYLRGMQLETLGPTERCMHDEALPGRRAAARRRGRALPVRPRAGLSGRQLRLPPHPVRGRDRGRDRAR